MYQNILIESLDYFGRGIAHIDNKIVFVYNALPNELVNIKIINNKKRFSEAIVTKYLKTSPKRIDSICPYFNKCGGCQLLNLNYEDTLNFKLNKVKELLTKNKINVNNLEIINNENNYYYRNKLSLKIINEEIGFYENKTHNLISISKCFIANNNINTVIDNYKLLNIKNGDLIIRCNSNNEILLIINSQDKLNIDINNLKEKIKLIGIVYNNETIYGNNFYYERIYHKLFKISYDAFFQVNSYITTKIFQELENNLKDSKNVLDLYCGVGTLSIIASNYANVIGVEIIPNAVLDATYNAKLNNSSAKFVLGDVAKTVSKLEIDFDTLILDPPRSGIDKNTINFILSKLPSKIIYISCDVATLIRDIKLLEFKYELISYKIFDMFSYTYHLESFVVLNLR